MQHTAFSQTGRAALLRGLVSLLLIGLVLLVGTLSRSPGLHASFHDAVDHHHIACPDHPHPEDDHDEKAACALCLFNHGGWLNDWQAPDFVRPILPEARENVSRPTDPVSTFRFTPTLGRGPPAFV